MAPGSASQEVASQPRQKRQKTKDRLQRRDGVEPAVVEIRNAIITAARTEDAALALQAFDRAVAKGIKLRPESYNTLLFLCAGGDRWMQRFEHLPVPWFLVRLEKPEEGQKPQPGEVARGAVDAQKVEPAELLRRGREILDHMKSAASTAVNEMCFTGLARIAAASGDAAAAFQAAKEGQEAGMPARLRTFLPALLAYVEAGDLAGALEVDEAMAAAALDLTETEYAALLLACQHGATPQQAAKVLGRMSKELTTLSQQTLTAAEQYFRSAAGAAALPEGQRWQVERCTVDAEGVTSTCGGHVQALDLEQEEFAAFSQAIAKLAATNERKPESFRAFQGWLQRHGPYHAILDGANIAFYGQNYQEGGFQFSQIGSAVETLVAERPDVKPLVLLHSRRLKDKPAQAAEAKALIERLQTEKMIYATPYGSNDDWYWIYAAVTAGAKGLLVSNDEMRDHIFQLLAPKYVLKWKQRHQMRYKFGSSGLELYKPAKYTACTQKLATGSWVLPAADSEEWLCARPVQA